MTYYDLNPWHLSYPLIPLAPSAPSTCWPSAVGWAPPPLPATSPLPGAAFAAPVRGVILPGAGDFCVFVAGTAPSCGEGEKKGSSSEADDMLATCPCWKKIGIWELVKSPGWEIYVNMIEYVDKLWIYIYKYIHIFFICI